MNARSLILSATAAAVLGGFSLPASAAVDPAKPAKPASACFFSRNWESWRSPDENTIYFRVNVRDYYKVDLSFGSHLLTWPDSHLISQVRGSDSICSPIDLDLKVSDGTIVEPLFVKAISKMTPEEVAAIPKKFLP